MPLEAQIEDLRAELKLSVDKRETRPIEREMAWLLAHCAASN